KRKIRRLRMGSRARDAYRGARRLDDTRDPARKGCGIMSAPFDQLREEMEVFDVDGLKVGKVVRIDEVLGYFETLGTFSGPRYIPFFAIEKIEPAKPTGVWLNVTKSVVADIYNHTPRAKPDLTAGGKLTGSGTVASGYTGRAVPLDADALREIRNDLFLG